MTYDFSFKPMRVKNSIEKDPAFQKLNIEKIIIDFDFDEEELL